MVDRGYKDAFPYQFWACLIAIVLTVTTNMISVSYVMYKEVQRNNDLFDWVAHNTTPLAFGYLFSLPNVECMKLLNSGIMGMRALKAPWDEHVETLWKLLGAITNILEDIPFLAVQLSIIFHFGVVEKMIFPLAITVAGLILGFAKRGFLFCLLRVAKKKVGVIKEKEKIRASRSGKSPTVSESNFSGSQSHSPPLSNAFTNEAIVNFHGKKDSQNDMSPCPEQIPLTPIGPDIQGSSSFRKQVEPQGRRNRDSPEAVKYHGGQVQPQAQPILEGRRNNIPETPSPAPEAPKHIGMFISPTKLPTMLQKKSSPDSGRKTPQSNRKHSDQPQDKNAGKLPPSDSDLRDRGKSESKHRGLNNDDPQDRNRPTESKYRAGGSLSDNDDRNRSESKHRASPLKPLLIKQMGPKPVCIEEEELPEPNPPLMLRVETCPIPPPPQTPYSVLDDHSDAPDEKDNPIP